MPRFIIVVLDGFGVGEMPDVALVRPQDCGSNTASKLLAHFPLKRLPVLEKLGLQNVVDNPASIMLANPLANAGRSNLAHQGGDTFMGHQEIMGTLPKPPLEQAFQVALPDIEAALLNHGYKAVRHTQQGLSVLVVEEGIVIGDNLEADLGQVYNLTCNFNIVTFNKLLEIAAVVRGANPVSRNIAFGGNISDETNGILNTDLPFVEHSNEEKYAAMERVFNAIEIKNDVDGKPTYIGVNSPDSGAYDEGFQVAHLGYGVDAKTQVPWQLHNQGVHTWLYGKVADIVQNPHGTSYTSVVDTNEVFRLLNLDLSTESHGFFCANIQETDLAGHQQDPKQYWKILEKADRGLSRVMEQMTDQDVLVVMADHGNDPFIGHTKHTREQVPLLAYKKGQQALNLGVRATMSDVGATVSAYFGADLPENGTPIIPLVHTPQT
ncbi:phosphopentomutase [Vibrio genomosp. F10]|uniref:phosphopentomutase n=1 Tax=Vibrio genomosp. F10 TaxID=723171 RepID=UPI0002E5047C|nr:phosphopentomutase [Vibrio genomosp. F10]OEF09377.1 phosphopentomutase [Vibrio genomosp. F10 str. 9ZB36]